MIDVLYFTAVILIFLRIGTFLITVPTFFPNGTPSIMKVFLGLMFSFILVPGIKYGYLSNINSNWTLFMYCLNEVVTGLVLGFITNLCFNVIRMAGSYMDMQLGFAMLSMFDPNTKSNSTLFERLIYWLSLMIFFIIDGHHMLINLMIDSFNIVNLGNSLVTDGSITYIFEIFSKYFIIGFKIAIPIIFIMIIVDLSLGLVSRPVPQLNVMILGMPMKILVGLATFSLALPLIVKAIVLAIDELPNIFRELYKYVPLVFVFASEDKTEEATPRKKRDARKKGQVAKSKDVPLALTLLTSTLVISILGAYVGNNLKSLMIHYLKDGITQDVNLLNLNSNSINLVLKFLLTFLPIVLPLTAVGVFANYIQTGFLLTSEPLKPKLSKLNPINGFKRIFSSRTAVELLKDIGIVSIVGYVAYNFVKDNYIKILNVGNLSINSLGSVMGDLVISIFTKITIIMIILALADYIYQRYMYNKDLKMTKQEVKEEFKQDEGDPQIKSKIKQKQREFATRRMMQSVPDATVVVTNPTHLAVALKYEEGRSEAPIVVAKGSDYVALKIKEIAKKNEVPVIENKPLARLLYSEVDIDSEIPVNMYQAVAEILALVLKLKKKKTYK
ncbi:fused FliR family export protein/FlhB family type III secretion system protein [Desnuesiella massiliensis]|uniref:fused FliR family export protein/FlhB family type III secretion system protein n=1 Tax=Desnuesiella massiliensis TaxID=1650662 RepID=UPI0006E21C54|nr:fused FliR family export protein/FlhB family type III secretion system protein [Desnuesiella massiliensis]